MCKGRKPRFDDLEVNGPGRADLRNADALLEPVAFVDSQMSWAMRVVCQYNRTLQWHRPVVIYRMDFSAGPPDCSNTAGVAGMVNVEISDLEIAIVELAGKKEKISRQE